MTKKLYSTAEIEVSWEPDLCLHSGKCVMGSARVFNPRRRPWIALEHETSERILEIVANCPSGALKARRLGAGEQGGKDQGGDDRVGGTPEQQAPVPTITASRNGPLELRFRCEIRDADGNLIRTVEKASLCRCGESKHKPFCDGSHRTNGFEG